MTLINASLRLRPLSQGALRRFSKRAKTDAAYCQHLVQRVDFERYLTLLLLPSVQQRTSAFALAAFNIQIAQVFDSSKERTISQMRLQFWHDTLDLIEKGNTPEQPVAQELDRAFFRYDLNKMWLKRIIDGRLPYLNRKPFTTMVELDTCSENTVSSFYYLLLQILGSKSLEADHAASHIGKAYGLVTLLRGVVHHASQSQVLIPIEKLLEFNVSEEEIIRGSREQKVKDMVFDLASNAHGHLRKAKSLEKNVPKDAHRAFLCTVVLEKYLDLLQNVDFDVFNQKLRQRNNLLPVHLMIRQIRGGY